MGLVILTILYVKFDVVYIHKDNTFYIKYSFFNFLTEYYFNIKYNLHLHHRQ